MRPQCTVAQKLEGEHMRSEGYNCVTPPVPDSGIPPHFSDVSYDCLLTVSLSAFVATGGSGRITTQASAACIFKPLGGSRCAWLRTTRVSSKFKKNCVGCVLYELTLGHALLLEWNSAPVRSFPKMCKTNCPEPSAKCPVAKSRCPNTPYRSWAGFHIPEK